MTTLQDRLDSTRRRYRFAALFLALGFLLGACTGGSFSGATIGSTTQNDPVAPDFAIAYIKRKLPAPNASLTTPLTDDLRVQLIWNGPADVYWRSSASPSAPEVNLTGKLTQGLWDARDLDVSYDGTKLLFSLRPPLIANAKDNEQPVWSLYEYDTTQKTLRRIISNDLVAQAGNDVGGHYLPDGRIVFSSSRQHGERAILINEGSQQYSARIESGPNFRGDRNLPAFVLHVMNADGSHLHQIDYNQSHDLDPSVLPNGQIVFSRWDAVNGSGMQLYSANPDGSNEQLLYGRNSHYTGTPNTTPVQFIQSRARTDGKIVSIIRPFPTKAAVTGITAYSGIAPLGNTEFGGNLVLIDQANYVEFWQGSSANLNGTGPGQGLLSQNNVITAPGVSPGGRYATAYPLADGTNRLLVSWTQCRLVIAGLYQPCLNSSLNAATLTTAPPLYGLWIYDPTKGTQQPLVQPQEGVMYSDAVSLEPRKLPLPGLVDAVAGVDYDNSLGQALVGILNIKSVYDFDGFMQAPGGGEASILAFRDPGQTTAAQRPARFLRLEKAVGLPDEITLPNLPGTAFGVSSVMRQILGYAPIEPDGSVEIEVPANVAFMISILDANGARLGSSHNHWLQLQVGETKTCNGCHVQNPDAPGLQNHAHGRAGLTAIANPGALTEGQPFPNTNTSVLAPSGPKLQETMAEARARVNCASATVTHGLADCTYLKPSVNVIYTDVWTSPAVRAPDPPIQLLYSALTTPPPLSASSTGCTLLWSALCRIVINYPAHIQPLWSAPRKLSSTTLEQVNGVLTPSNNGQCIACHSTKDITGKPQVPAVSLDLSATPSTQQADWAVSFWDLLFSRPPLVLSMGVVSPQTCPVTDPVTHLITQPLCPALPPPMNGAGARASAGFFRLFSSIADPVHYQLLSPSELRLITEWLDIGAQYYNDPFAIPLPGAQ